MKKTLSLLLAFVMLFSLAACGDSNGDDIAEINDPTYETVADREDKIQISVSNGPMGIGFAKLMTDRYYAYDVSYCDTVSEALELFNSGKTEVVSVSIEDAVKLYNESRGNLKMLAINTMGMTYILSGDSSIESIEDLNGKDVYCPSDNATVKAIFLYILDLYGVNGINIQYKPAEEIKELMREGTIDFCVLPEFDVTGVTSKTERELNCLDLGILWEEKLGFELVQGCIVARSDFVKENTEKITELLGYYEASINFLTKNNMYGASYLVAAGFLSDSQVAYELVMRSNLRYVEGGEMKALAEKNIAELDKIAPEMFGGAIPAEDFYA